jgi:hypothetical protein
MNHNGNNNNIMLTIPIIQVSNNNNNKLIYKWKNKRKCDSVGFCGVTLDTGNVV